MIFPLLTDDFYLCGFKRKSGPIACCHLQVAHGFSQLLLTGTRDVQVGALNSVVDKSAQVPFLNSVSKLQNQMWSFRWRAHLQSQNGALRGPRLCVPSILNINYWLEEAIGLAAEWKMEVGGKCQKEASDAINRDVRFTKGNTPHKDIRPKCQEALQAETDVTERRPQRRAFCSALM